MPPPESIRDQIIDALETAFASITAGSDYWYTPGAVKCVDAFTSQCLDEGFIAAGDTKATLYLLTPDDEQTAEQTAGSIEALMSIDLLVARQIDPADHPLKEPSTGSLRKIQNRLARDLEMKLRSDSALGGLCINAEIVRKEFGAEEVGAGGAWACVLARVQVHYEYWSTAP